MDAIALILTPESIRSSMCPSNSVIKLDLCVSGNGKYVLGIRLMISGTFPVISL